MEDMVDVRVKITKPVTVRGLFQLCEDLGMADCSVAFELSGKSETRFIEGIALDPDGKRVILF